MFGFTFFINEVLDVSLGCAESNLLPFFRKTLQKRDPFPMLRFQPVPRDCPGRMNKSVCLGSKEGTMDPLTPGSVGTKAQVSPVLPVGLMCLEKKG